jgi:hypothetical protein
MADRASPHSSIELSATACVPSSWRTLDRFAHHLGAHNRLCTGSPGADVKADRSTGYYSSREPKWVDRSALASGPELRPVWRQMCEQLSLRRSKRIASTRRLASTGGMGETGDRGRERLPRSAYPSRGVATSDFRRLTASRFESSRGLQFAGAVWLGCSANSDAEPLLYSDAENLKDATCALRRQQCV